MLVLWEVIVYHFLPAILLFGTIFTSFLGFATALAFIFNHFCIVTLFTINHFLFRLAKPFFWIFVASTVLDLFSPLGILEFFLDNGRHLPWMGVIVLPVDHCRLGQFGFFSIIHYIAIAIHVLQFQVLCCVLCQDVLSSQFLNRQCSGWPACGELLFHYFWCFGIFVRSGPQHGRSKRPGQPTTMEKIMQVILVAVVVVVAGATVFFGIYILWSAFIYDIYQLSSTTCLPSLPNDNQLIPATTTPLINELLSTNTIRVPYIPLLDLSLSFLMSGMPPHPGPGEQIFDFVVQNVTSLTTNVENVTKIISDFAFLQEVSVPKSEIYDYVHKFKALGYKSIISGTDPEQSCTGGVATIYKQHCKCIQLQPITSRFKEVVGNGRVQLVGLPTISGAMCKIMNVYVWSGASSDASLMERSDDLMDIIFTELENYSGSPWIIVGDFNADLQDFPSVSSALDSGECFDLGALPGIGDPSHTSFPHNSDKSFRRDFALASPNILQYVIGFEVVDYKFDVHSGLHFKISFPKEIPDVIRQQKCPSFKELLVSCVSEDNGTKDELMGSFKKALDVAFSAVSDRLDSAFQKKDTNRLWKIWTKTVGRTMCDFLKSKGCEKGSIFCWYWESQNSEAASFQTCYC